MARIRSIKPEFWSDERLARVPPWVRLLFIGLWNVADEEGRLRGSALLVRAHVFPYDADVDVEKGLVLLAELGRIVRYEVGGEAYLWVCNFSEHQKTDPRLASKLPAPPAPNSHQPIGANRGESGALRTSTFDSSGADLSAPSRWQVAGGREQVAGGREGAGAPPLDPVGSMSGTPAPATLAKAAAPDLRASERQPDESLRDRLEGAFLGIKGAKYGWRTADDNSVRELLVLADNDWGEVVRRWRLALKRTKWPACGTVQDLSKHWNHYAADEPQSATKGRAPESDRDWSKAQPVVQGAFGEELDLTRGNG